MQRILTIDPGANCGWAVRTRPNRVMFGTEDFTKYAGVDGRVHDYFYRWFEGFLATVQPERVVIEAAIFRGANSEYLYGFANIITMLCYRRSIPLEKVAISTAKKHITGKGDADKSRVMKCIRDLGYDIETDHEADALAILHFREAQPDAMNTKYTGKTVQLKSTALNRIKRRNKKA